MPPLFSSTINSTDLLQVALNTAAAELSLAFNASVYFGVAGVGLPQAIVAANGAYRNRSLPASAETNRARLDDLIPGGSVAKVTTATQCLQLAEAGKLDLDKPVVDYIDPWLAQLGVAKVGQPFPKLTTWWGQSPLYVNRMTTRQLLSMRGGIGDYDDGSIAGWTFSQTTARGRDFEPLDYIVWGQRNKSFLWPPGHGGAYSGTGYVLLGFVLASVTGATDWDGLDQTAIFDDLPAAEAAWYKQEMRFMGRGPCSQYGERVIPQYANMQAAAPPQEPPAVGDFVDLLSTQSCLNGWTMGNILTSTAGFAQFYADLHATPSKLLSEASLKQMLTFQPLSIGENPPAGTPYGLGAMKLSFDLSADKSRGNLTYVGHGGEDWGSGFPLANWVVELNASLIIAFNNGAVPMGMNTSLTRQQNALLTFAASCRGVDALYVFRGHPGLDCSHYGASPRRGVMA